MIMNSISSLVTSEWLFDHHQRSDVVILDATWTLPAQQRDSQRDFKQSHLPGAQFFDIDAIADHNTSLPHMLPSTEMFSLCARQLGISSDTHVVVYDSNQFMASARVWWTFRVFGHEKVSVLNGGMWAWLEGDYPLESGAKLPRALGTLKAERQDHLVVTKDQLITKMGSPSHQLVDARPLDRFKGIAPEPRPGLRSGHIPGSRSLFFKALLDQESPTLLPVKTLERVFEGAGIDPQRPVTASCGSGVTAAVIALGLYQLGQDKVAIYDGSWSEWGLDDALPIITEAAS